MRTIATRPTTFSVCHDEHLCEISTARIFAPALVRIGDAELAKLWAWSICLYSDAERIHNRKGKSARKSKIPKLWKIPRLGVHLRCESDYECEDAAILVFKSREFCGFFFW